MAAGEPSFAQIAQTARALALRIVPALVLLAISILVVFAGSWAFTLWVALFGVLMAIEWHGIAFQGSRPHALPLHLSCLPIVLGAVTLGQPIFALIVLFLGMAMTAIVASRARQRAIWAALGVLYTIGPLAALVWLRLNAQPAFFTVLWLLSVVWATDTAALVTGRLFGGPLLAPRISPKKTWAGLAGGMCAAALVGWGAAGVIAPAPASAPVLALMSALLAIVAQLGDLTESAFKRHFKVKDSSQLIPGQGGVLDRVDGLIFATLAVFALVLASGGNVLSLGAHL